MRYCQRRCDPLCRMARSKAAPQGARYDPDHRLDSDGNFHGASRLLHVASFPPAGPGRASGDSQPGHRGLASGPSGPGQASPGSPGRTRHCLFRESRPEVKGSAPVLDRLRRPPPWMRPGFAVRGIALASAGMRDGERAALPGDSASTRRYFPAPILPRVSSPRAPRSCCTPAEFIPRYNAA
jgi:hypothetical protein